MDYKSKGMREISCSFACHWLRIELHLLTYTNLSIILTYKILTRKILTHNVLTCKLLKER